MFEGKLAESLLCAIVRVASLASLYRQLSMPIRDAKSVDGRNSLVSKLLCHLPSATLLDNDKISLRYLEMGFGRFCQFLYRSFVVL